MRRKLLATVLWLREDWLISIAVGSLLLPFFVAFFVTARLVHLVTPPSKKATASRIARDMVTAWLLVWFACYVYGVTYVTYLYYRLFALLLAPVGAWFNTGLLFVSFLFFGYLAVSVGQLSIERAAKTKTNRNFPVG